MSNNLVRNYSDNINPLRELLKDLDAKHIKNEELSRGGTAIEHWDLDGIKVIILIEADGTWSIYTLMADMQDKEGFFPKLAAKLHKEGHL